MCLDPLFDKKLAHADLLPYFDALYYNFANNFLYI